MAQCVYQHCFDVILGVSDVQSDGPASSITSGPSLVSWDASESGTCGFWCIVGSNEHSGLLPPVIEHGLRVMIVMCPLSSTRHARNARQASAVACMCINIQWYPPRIPTFSHTPHPVPYLITQITTLAVHPTCLHLRIRELIAKRDARLRRMSEVVRRAELHKSTREP